MKGNAKKSGEEKGDSVSFGINHDGVDCWEREHSLELTHSLEQPLASPGFAIVLSMKET